jgi:hypothetical protein
MTATRGDESSATIRATTIAPRRRWKRADHHRRGSNRRPAARLFNRLGRKGSDVETPIRTTPPPGRAPVPGRTGASKPPDSGDPSKLGRPGRLRAASPQVGGHHYADRR